MPICTEDMGVLAAGNISDMNFDSLCLAAVANELQELVLGARVEKVSQPGALDVVVHFYHLGRKRALEISLEPLSARITSDGATYEPAITASLLHAAA